MRRGGFNMTISVVLIFVVCLSAVTGEVSRVQGTTTVAPFVVVVNAGGTPRCGGAVFAPTWVMTAGFCVSQYQDTPEEVTVTFSLSGDLTNSENKDYSISNIYVNANYVYPVGNAFDIGLLKLTSIIQDTYLSNIYMDDVIYPGPFKLYGWGGSGTSVQTKLAYLDTDVMSIEDCVYSEDIPSPLSYMICISDPSLLITKKDAGGPLIVHVDGVPKLVGILSNYLLTDTSTTKIVTHVAHKDILGWISTITQQP